MICSDCTVLVADAETKLTFKESSHIKRAKRNKYHMYEDIMYGYQLKNNPRWEPQIRQTKINHV